MAQHVLEKLAERGIQQQAVREVLLEGEKIRDYTQDRPFASAFILGLYWRQTASRRGRMR